MNSSTETSPVHAWYSAKQEQSRRKSPGNNIPACLWYADAAGESIEVTMVTQGPEHGCNETHLDDLKYRGLVVRYAGVCRN